MLKEFSFEEIDKIAQGFEGWLNANEPELLYNCAKSLKGDGAIVEIGSWCGKSLAYITAGAIEGGFKNKIFSIDPFLTSKDEPNYKYEIFVSNMKTHNFWDKITHIKQKSQIAGENFEEKIEFLFIDGFHKYDAVKKDFELFYPKIINGGFVAIHDVYYYKGPTDLVEELLERETFKMLTFCDSIVLAQKVEKITQSDIKKNKMIFSQIKDKIKACNMVPVE